MAGYVDIEKFIETFLDQLTNPGTRDTYRNAVQNLRKWTDAKGIDLLDVTEVDLDRHFAELSATLAPGTVRVRHAGLTAFYDFALAQHVLSGPSPMADRQRPKGSSFREPSGLTVADFQDLLATADRSSDLNAALAYMFLLAALKLDEVTNLDVTDVRFEEDVVVLDLGDRTVTLPPLVAKRVRPLVDGRRSGPLFVTKIGTRHKRRLLADKVERLGQQAGMAKRLRVTTMQTLMFETALASGVNPWDLAEAVGAKTWRKFAYLEPGSAPKETHPAFLILRRLNEPGQLTDLGHQVDSLLEDPDVHPVAPIVVAGALLEARLRSLVQQGGLTIKGKPGISAYAQALRGNVITDMEWREVELLGAWRIRAAHGEDLVGSTTNSSESSTPTPPDP